MSFTPELSANAWRDGLRDFIAEKRRIDPLPQQENLSPEEFQQFRIIGGELVGWYQNRLEHLLESRIVFENLMKFDLTPFAVVQTSLPGLVASQLVWSKPQKTLVFVTEAEMKTWTKQHPDEDFRFHVLHWSDFASPSGEEQAEIAARFPDLDLATCCFHEEGDLYGPNMGCSGTHLWQWGNGELSLVQSGYKDVRY